MDIFRAHKVRGTSLPPEFMLIRMIENIQNPHSSWTADIPISKWKGVMCLESGDIDKIRFERSKLQGPLRWDMLPRSLTHFGVYSNKLMGEVDLSELPPKLKFLDGSYNMFTGGLDLCHLPMSLEEIFFSENKLSGRVDFSHLPHRLCSLALRHNRLLGGEMRLRELPSSLSYRPIFETSIVVIDDSAIN